MTPTPQPYDPRDMGRSFKELDVAFEQADFRIQWKWGKLPTSFETVGDVLRFDRGIFGFHVLYYHPEDVGYFDISEGIDHYASYNAGTRLLQLYPETLVLEEHEVSSPEGVSQLLKKLAREPYQVAFNRDVQRWCRVLQVPTENETLSLPLTSQCSELVRGRLSLKRHKK